MPDEQQPAAPVPAHEAVPATCQLRESQELPAAARQPEDPVPAAQQLLIPAQQPEPAIQQPPFFVQAKTVSGAYISVANCSSASTKYTNDN